MKFLLAEEDKIKDNYLAERDDQEVDIEKVVDDIINELDSLTTEKVLSILNTSTRNDIDTSSSMFILPNGKILSVADILITNNIDDMFDDIHDSISYALVYNLAKQMNAEESFVDILDDTYIDRKLDSIMSILTYDLGWARINCGTTLKEDRFYCVLPNYMNSTQYHTLQNWLEWGYDTGKQKVLVFVSSYEDSNWYSFSDNLPEDIIKKIKRYYSSGKLYENRNELKENMDITNEVQRAVDNVMKNKSKYKNQDDLESAIYSAIANCFSGMHGVTRTTSDMIDDVYEKELERVGLNTMNENVDTFNDFEDEFYFYFKEIEKILSTINGDVDEPEGEVTENRLHLTFYSNVDKNVKYNYPKEVEKLLIDYFETETRFNQWVEVYVTPADKFFYSIPNSELESYTISITARDNGYEPYKNNKTKSRVIESNELADRAKKHKKKSKGMGWHMAVNAGDVEKGIEVFNNSTSNTISGSGEAVAMGEAIEKHLYYYDGPIYYRGNKISISSDIYTTAKSFEEAARNILFKAAKGDEELYHYDIVDDKIKQMPDGKLERPKCQQCGYEINDNGDCPVCDYGEDDLLESLSDLEALWQLRLEEDNL